MQLCQIGTRKEYKMQDDDLEVSRQMSKKFRDERLAKAQGMLRLYTPSEEDILRKGLKESELNDTTSSNR